MKKNAILINIIFLFFFFGCETSNSHSEIASKSFQESVVIENGDYSKLDKKTIYRHVAALLDLDKNNSPYTKLIKEKNVYGYKVRGLCKFVDIYNTNYAGKGFSLDCPKLIKLFCQKHKTS